MNEQLARLHHGWPSLNFANTKIWPPGHSDDIFQSYASLVGWFQKIHVLSAEDAERMVRLSAERAADEQRAADIQAVLERAARLRDVYYRIFSAVSSQQPPDPQDMEQMNQAVAEALSRLRVTAAAGAGSAPAGAGSASAATFTWEWAGAGESLDWMLWPVARTAADLLTSEYTWRIRRCGECGWLFIDTSRNGKRRWCEMKTCGNRAKARRHYHRQRGLVEG